MTVRQTVMRNALVVKLTTIPAMLAGADTWAWNRRAIAGKKLIV